MKILSLFFSVALCLQASGEVPGSITTSYTALLSKKDHYNSKGKKLITVADIIRQDRANFHKFKKRDRFDSTDSIYMSAKRRAQIPKTLATVGKALSAKILKGEVRVVVKVIEHRRAGELIFVELFQPD